VSDIEDQIRNYINEQFIYDREGFKLTPGYPLLENGLIDSLAIFQLISFIGTQFGVEIGSEKIVLENFSTVEIIADLVRSYKA